MIERNLVNAVILITATAIIGFFVITTVIPMVTELRDRLNARTIAITTALK